MRICAALLGGCDLPGYSGGMRLASMPVVPERYRAGGSARATRERRGSSEPALALCPDSGRDGSVTTRSDHHEGEEQ